MKILKNKTELNESKIQDVIIMLKERKKTNIKKTKIKNIGNIPVITQEEKFISGYYDDIIPINANKTNKYIVFGDHSLTKKLIDFPFITGADGTQVFQTKNNIIVDYLYFYISQNNFLKSQGYRRHFSLLKEKTIKFPDLKQQEKIASVLSKQERQIEIIETLIEKLEKRNQYYAEKLLSGEKRIRKNDQGEIEFYDNTEWQKFYIQKRCFEIPKDYQPILLKNCDFIKLTRGKIISKKDIEKNNGCYPIYSSSVKNNGLMGNYGNYDYDEELITWSVDGGGDLFYREKHKFSVTNVSGIMKIVDNFNAVKLKYLYYLFSWQHKKYKFDYSNKAHPSVINELYFFTNINIEEQINIINYLDVLFKEKEILEKLLIKEKLRFQWMLDNLLSGEYQIVD